MKMIPKRKNCLPKRRLKDAVFLGFALWALLLLFSPSVFSREEEEIPPSERLGIPETAAEPTLTYGGEIDFNSIYLWRGFTYTEGPTLNPSAWVSFHKFTLNIWSDLVLTDDGLEGKFDEVDFTLSYSYQWKNLSIDPAVSFYTYHYRVREDYPNTAEAFLRFGYNVGPFQFFTSHAFDIMAYRKSYFGEVGVLFEYEIDPTFSLETAVDFGFANSTFNRNYGGVSKFAANVIDYKIAFFYRPQPFLYLKPHVEFSALLDSKLRALVDRPNVIAGGMAVGVEF